jgi:VWFA-related protein
MAQTRVGCLIRTACGLVVASTLAARLLDAQQPAPAAPAAGVPENAQQPPIFRGGANFVYVDVYPRAGGRIVDGLSRQDFQVFEDGKPQAVETFELVRFNPLTPDAEVRDPNTKEEGDRAARDPHNRVFVVYLDPFHTSVEGSHEGPPVVTEFLRRTIGPTDVFGVMVPETPVQQLTFGRRTETIESELKKYWTWGEEGRTTVPRSETERRILTECLDVSGTEELVLRLYREDQLMTSLEHLVMGLGDMRDERKNILFLSEGWVPQPPAEGLLKRTRPTDIPPIGPGPGGRIGSGVTPGGQQIQDRNWCNGLIARLSGIDFERRFREFVAAARRANVAFYPIDLGGLKVGLAAADARVGVPPPNGAYEATSRDRLNTLRELAENTDGLAVVQTNAVTESARRVADTLSSYYLLGYYSTNTNLDGRYRRIEVKVSRPGTSVAARAGYQSPTAEDFKRWSNPVTPSATAARVAEALGQLAAVRRDADLLVEGAQTSDGLDVVVELPASAVGDTKWASGADVDVAAAGAAGVALRGTARIDPGARSALVHLTAPPAASGPWQVRARASAGSAEVESRADVSAAPAPTLQVRRLRGTAAPRVPPRPTVDLEFRRAERLIVEATDPGAAALDVQVLDRRGQPLQVQGAVAQTRRADGTWVVTVLPAAFADGDYALQLAASTAGVREEHYVPFRVVR